MKVFTASPVVWSSRARRTCVRQVTAPNSPTTLVENMREIGGCR